MTTTRTIADCAGARCGGVRAQPVDRGAGRRRRLESGGCVAVPATYVGELGMRLWFGRAQTKKDLFDTSGTMLVSRLDYNDMTIFTGEAFSRLDFNNGWFIKGYFGGGGLFGGKLKDEDFPPVIVPYSATLSDNKSGSVIYGSVDAGIKLIRGPDFHVGAFRRLSLPARLRRRHGLHPDRGQSGHLRRRLFRTRSAGSRRPTTGIRCASASRHRWSSTGAGSSPSTPPGCPLRSSTARTRICLRIGPNPGDFTGPIPEDGKGWGYQFDAIVSYRFNDWISVGAGGRYWHVEAKGHTHFEGHVVGFDAQPQVVHWQADHFGGFIQASIKLGPYRVISGN